MKDKYPHKVAGVCAILATFTLVPWFAFPLLAPAFGIEFPQSLELADWARFKVEHASIMRVIDWLVVISLLFETVAAVGFFYGVIILGKPNAGVLSERSRQDRLSGRSGL